MCTLSWAPEPDGYLLCFNRDEQKSRSPGLPPARAIRDGVGVLAPTDSEAGGSWIGVNAYGLSLCLANRYDDPPQTPPGEPISRGLLLTALFSSGSQSEVVTRITTADLARYRPFTIACAEPGSPLLLAAWNGQRLNSRTWTAPGLVVTSSGVNQAGAEAARRALFESWAASRHRFDTETLTLLHRSHEPARGPLSICMHRDDAETVSFSRVEVTGRQVSLFHLPAAPCSGVTGTSLNLDWVPAPALALLPAQLHV